jgi:hypothetical protein
MAGLFLFGHPKSGSPKVILPPRRLRIKELIDV